MVKKSKKKQSKKHPTSGRRNEKHGNRILTDGQKLRQHSLQEAWQEIEDRKLILLSDEQILRQ